ncbi:MAG: hypothetical protein QM813_19590 [Verrucomicrobiota bacterium]
MKIIRAGLVGGVGFFLAFALQAQVVEKVVDLNIASSGPGGPLDRFTQIGTNLWFTTEKGGVFDPAGTISRYDLVTREVTVVASLQNSTGTSPESSLLAIGDEAYFTTKSGGTGNAGTIAKINLNDGTVTALYHFPPNNATTRGNGTQTGATSRSGLVSESVKSCGRPPPRAELRTMGWFSNIT